MNKIRTLHAILSTPWALERRFLEANLPLVAQMLLGEKIMFNSGSRVEPKAYDSDYGYAKGKGETVGDDFYVYAAYGAGSTVKKGRWNSFDDAPEGSVAVIPVTGPILKYGGDCGEPGSIHMSEWIKAANRSSKIAGLLLEFDTPGGQVSGTATLSEDIMSSKKPVVGVVNDGMMASAGVWLGTSAREIYATRKMDHIGSIGVFATLADYRGYFEQKGIKLHEIYAPQSTDKNRDYKEALEGNYDLVQQELKLIAAEFIKHVKSTRKGKLDFDEENDPFTGKMFSADKAANIGLIDGIKSFDDAVLRVAELGS